MKKVFGFAIVILAVVLFSGIAEAFRTGDTGSEVIVVEKGDKGVWGISAGLHETGMLPKGMSVNKAYANACVINFGSLERCVERSPLLKVDDELLFPFVSRVEFTEKVTAEVARTLEANFKLREEELRENVASLQTQLDFKNRAFNYLMIAMLIILVLGLGAYLFGEKTGRASVESLGTVPPPLTEEEIEKRYLRNTTETHKGDPGG